MATVRKTPLGWNIDSFTPAKWIIPGTGRHFNLHPVWGFIAACYIYWYDRYVEKINPVGNEPWDEWGHVIRKNRNANSWSEHGGCAWDVNAVRHPNGVDPRKTFTAAQLKRMRNKIALWNKYVGTTIIRLGIDYQRTPDGMHGELYYKPVALKKLANILVNTPAGRAVLKANPERRAALRKAGVKA